jgi:hypothetical protein
MNPVEQRQRHSAVQQLAADTEILFDAVHESLEFHRGALVKHDERLALADEHFRRIEARFEAMNALTFWQRVSWLLTGH